MKQKSKLVSKIPVISHAAARPRLTIGALLGIACGFFLPAEWDISTRILVALDTGLLLYLILAFSLMAKSKTSDMRIHAAAQESGRIAVLLLSVLTRDRQPDSNRYRIECRL